MKYLAILTCHRHGFMAIAVEDEAGGGLRITPSKCCGQWHTVKRWPIDEAIRQDLQRCIDEKEGL